MESPLVSIAMCTYNGAKYITKQLDSILAQTYTNIEIVIVDDRSSDNTFEIISKYAEHDSRIKHYRNEENIGFNRNFEKAVKYTTGQYIAISDQDDIWLPHKIEALINTIGDNWLVFSNSVKMDDDDNLLDEHLLRGGQLNLPDYKALLLKNLVTGHTTLFNRELLRYIFPFPQEDGFYDWWMGFVALYHHKLVYLNKVLTQYRIHNSSVIRLIKNTGKKNLIRRELATVKVMLRNILTYSKLLPQDRAFIENMLNIINEGSYAKLVKLVYADYAYLFADGKQRSGLSKLNFAIKYARRLSAGN